MSTAPPQSSRGVLTIATGQKRYIRLAVNMALSCRHNNPTLPLAIVTDRRREQIPNVFDVVVPVDPTHGAALRQKLFIDTYSPFQETLFIDSDCLVAGNLDEDFHRLGVHNIGIAGTLESHGHWYNDVASLCKQIGRDAIPRINSGLIFLRRSEDASHLLNTARDIIDRSAEFGIPNTHGQTSDEPALSLAMALHHVPPVANKYEFMPTHISNGFEAMDMDVIRGTCWYRIAGKIYHPRVAHFVAWRWQLPIYRREAVKLRLMTGRRTIDGSLGGMVNAGFALTNRVRPIVRTLRKVATQLAHVITFT